MLKFNNNNIFTGYLKQLLADFHLPTYKIYTKKNQEYYNKYGVEKDILPTIKKTNTNLNIQYIPYIKDNTIQYFVNNTWEDSTKQFCYNTLDLNNTKTLEIKNNIYDTYTHEYLGDYLRFKRDYNNIDLMSMYNCFNNNICNSLLYSWQLHDSEDNCNHIVSFDTSNTQYKIYMFPVKLFQNYTIAIDSSLPIEICCGIYTKYQDTREKVQKIPELTYKRFNSLNFNTPVLYSLLTMLDIETKNTWTEIAKNEQNLKMFIKVPANNNSSIVVLEGNYINYNNSILNFSAVNWLTDNTWKVTGNLKFYWGPNKNESGHSFLENELFLEINNTIAPHYILYKYENNKWVKIKTFYKTSKAYSGDSCPNIMEQDAIHGFDLLLQKANESGSDNIEILTESGSSTQAQLYIANTRWKRKQNYTVTNFNPTICENAGTESGGMEAPIIIPNTFEYFTPISALQLLRLNTGESYPFADRLIEYLTNNVISQEDTILDNIKRVQTVINLGISKGIKENTWTIPTLKSNILGPWNQTMCPVLYDQFNTDIKVNINDINHDILGYVDKDIEKYYTAKTGEFINNNAVYTTIMNVDLYTTNTGLYSDLGKESK